MYPPNTTLVYSNFTTRSVKYMPKEAKDVVVFGIQYTVKYILDLYENNFFSKPKGEVVGEAKKYLSSYLGSEYDTSHFETLHDLGYLPLCIKGLDEGTVVGEKIPILTIYNTHPDFYWLPNFLETLISSLLWKPLHSASMAYGFKKVMTKWARKTDEKNIGLVDFLGHDFSFRGMQHPESAISSALGFLTSFKGTDTIPSLQAAKDYYNSENVGFSVPASEHAVMTAYGKENEIDGFKRLMNQFPEGILSVVSDSFDLWAVCTKFVVELKEQILARNGKLVIRPDSGDPVDILCGEWDEFRDDGGNYNKVPFAGPKGKGVIELLWDVFGGTINKQGYRVLDSHIGAIYGDSVNLERAEQISERLEKKGFASTNVVLGIGSYSMGYATRDNQGGAIKATYCEVNGIGREIFKDPITDDGVKKSRKGLLRVTYGKADNDEKFIIVDDQMTWEQEKTGLLTTVFKDGKLMKTITLDEIRAKLSL